MVTYMNSVIKYLERTVEKFPDRTAVEDESGALTYRELLSESKAVASAILACAGNNAPAAVLLPKCRQCLPAFMGILYSGRPYAPVNYTEPIARIKATVQNLAPSVILTDEPGAKRLEEAGIAGCTILLYDAIKDTPPETERLQAALDRVVDTDPAYIIHTSGSTGTPKGVTIPHRGIVNFASWAVKKFHIT